METTNERLKGFLIDFLAGENKDLQLKAVGLLQELEQTKIEVKEFDLVHFKVEVDMEVLEKDGDLANIHAFKSLGKDLFFNECYTEEEVRSQIGRKVKVYNLTVLKPKN